MTTLGGKGGVGKTAISAGVAAGLAAAGWDVLVVGLDAQGDSHRDFGIPERASDRGRSILDAALAARSPGKTDSGSPLRILKQVRERLDVISGGNDLEEVYRMIEKIDAYGDGLPDYRLIEDLLKPVAGDYDLVILDLPPGRQLLQRACLTASRWVLSPTREDASSIDGVGRMLQLAASVVAGGHNPDLVILGAVVLGTPAGKPGEKRRREVKEAIVQLTGGHLHVFETQIRHSASAIDLRRAGLTWLEYEVAQAAAAKRRRDKVFGRLDEEAEEGPAVSPYRDGAGIASDYQRLIEEIVARMNEYNMEAN